MLLYARKGYFRRKAGNQAGELSMPVLPGAKRLRHTLDEANKEKAAAAKPQ
jgi:hypothetical protein